MIKTSILKKPIITEKSVKNSSTYTFEVEKSGTKKEIKQEIEELFGVKVLSVRTISLKGRKKKAGRYVFRTPSRKKAIVKLLPNDKIDLFESQTQPELSSKEKKGKNKK